MIYVFTLPIGALIGLPSLALLIIVSIIGLAENDPAVVALGLLIGFPGLVMFIITGWTGLNRNTPVYENAG